MSGINGVVWVFSSVLAVVFLVTGVTKAYRYEQAKKFFPWVNDIPRVLVQLIGSVEILCALGLILPVATGFYPWLTSAAANMLALLMLLAIGFHLRRKETDAAVVNVLLLLMVAFVAYFRLPLMPPI